MDNHGSIRSCLKTFRSSHGFTQRNRAATNVAKVHLSGYSGKRKEHGGKVKLNAQRAKAKE